MRAASQLLGGERTDVNDAHALARNIYMPMIKSTNMQIYEIIFIQDNGMKGLVKLNY